MLRLIHESVNTKTPRSYMIIRSDEIRIPDINLSGLLSSNFEGKSVMVPFWMFSAATMRLRLFYLIPDLNSAVRVHASKGFCVTA
jgi:hypothetical protein